MASFIENDGELIIEATLTDTARYRMAKGDFKIVKYAFGDDEVDYSKYDLKWDRNGGVEAMVSPDQYILKSPVLQPMKDNYPQLKNKLITLENSDWLYLPELKLCDGGYQTNLWRQQLGRTRMNRWYRKIDINGHPEAQLANSPAGRHSYVISVDATTDDLIGFVGTFRDPNLWPNPGPDPIRRPRSMNGIMRGSKSSWSPVFEEMRDGKSLGDNLGAYILVEYGINNPAVHPRDGLPESLEENTWIIEMDDRLGHLTDIYGNDVQASYIDDDHKATYYIRPSMGRQAWKNLLDPPFDSIRGIGELSDEIGNLPDWAQGRMADAFRAAAPGAASPSNRNQWNEPLFQVRDGEGNWASFGSGDGLDGNPNFNLWENKVTKHRVRGPRGWNLKFKVRSSHDLEMSIRLFEKLGSTLTNKYTSPPASEEELRDYKLVTMYAAKSTGTEYYYIDSIIKVTAATVGRSIDIPITYIKVKNEGIV